MSEQNASKMESQNIHRLIGLRGYLCGAMDRVADGGLPWRQEITPLLEDRGVIVFDPANKPLHSVQDETNRTERAEWVMQGRYDLLISFMKEIRGQDLRMINVCDFVIVRVDPLIHMVGSYEEVAIANHEKKPILVWVVGGKQNTPWWLFGQLPEPHIFGNREDLLTYLDHVDTAEEVETYRRWFFFNQQKVYNRKILSKLSSISE